MIINYQLAKVLKRVAVIFLIAVFSVAGIVACSKTTDPSQQSSEVVVPDDTGPVTPGDTNVTPEPGDTNVTPEPGDTNVTPEPGDTNVTPEPTLTFPQNTYYKIYVPFGKGLSASDEWTTTVSYQDTNTLIQLWKDIIDGGKDNDGKRWFIRDGDNRAKADDPSIREKNHYYYFDKNFDLVYHRNGKGTLKIRKLVGAVIVQYYRGKNANTYTVAGLYQNLIENAGQYGWMHFSKFMHAGYNPDNDKRKVGDLELLVLNVGYGGDGEYGVDAYYNVWNKGGWRDNIEYFLGQHPYFVDNRDPNNYALNQKVNHTYDTAAFNFKFVSLQPEAWHLEEHPEGDWVQR